MNKMNMVIISFLLQSMITLGMDIFSQSTQLPADLNNLIFSERAAEEKNNEWWYCKERNGVRVRDFRINCNNDDIYLETGPRGRKVQILDAKTNQLINDFDHDYWVDSMGLNYNSTHLVTGAHDFKARIFDLESGQLVASFDHDFSILSVSLNDDATRLATAALGKVRVFDVKEDLQIALFEHNSIVLSVALSGDGTRLATYLLDERIQMFNVETEQVIAQFCHDRKIYSMRLINDGALLEAIVLDADYNIRTFEKYTNATLEQLFLKDALLMWPMLKKIDKNINTPDLLLSDVAHTYQVKQEGVFNAWKSFPEKMRESMLRKMCYWIEKYGKKIDM